jgi:hypothetical protein
LEYAAKHAWKKRRHAYSWAKRQPLSSEELHSISYTLWLI